jgi:gamma-D-glutamyl-L-lysine dipeptidyl-peptidase
MGKEIQQAIDILSNKYKDRRIHVFHIEEKLEGSVISFSGEVLEPGQLAELMEEIIKRTSFQPLNFRDVDVLQKPSNEFYYVSTNFTSMHNEPSWLSEQITQCSYGLHLEILKSEGKWSFVRQDDGYLGWVYKLYCSKISPEKSTHIVVTSSGGLFEKPTKESIHLSRLFAGTFVSVAKTQGEWAYLSPHKEQTPNAMTGGWILKDRLTAIEDFPITVDGKRQAIVDEAFRLVGVPYLWGGTSGNGIDCSGLAQLCHRMAGVTILRDADMQKLAGKPVEYPFKPGDLVFFGDEDDLTRITHVGISLGGWKIIHSSRSKNGVYVDDIQKVPHLKKTFAGGCTYL